MESTSSRKIFMSQLSSSFGSGGMTLALIEVQFSAFIQHLKEEGIKKKIRTYQESSMQYWSPKMWKGLGSWRKFPGMKII